MKQRLDQLVFSRGLVASRSQAESWIKLGKVFVDGSAVTKPGTAVDESAVLELKAEEQYVSRAGLKLASVATILHLDFHDKIMLDVGSSTGGFTDYALKHGIRKVYAVDVGTNQLHPLLRGDSRIELYEQTDIRNVTLGGNVQKAPPTTPDAPASDSVVRAPAKVRDSTGQATGLAVLSDAPDLVVIDVSFISLRDVLPHIATLCGPQTIIAAMVKPQFEARESGVMHKGVIKNDRMRRDILKDFEQWAVQYFVVLDKADSDVAGTKGNRERFYKLKTNLQHSSRSKR
jgi:23S rRNA (cytidine1920-2'-O)/16S rRNA (cytidine1409-2'-O)-methyltransferase